MAEATKSTVVRTVQEEAFTLTLTADEFWYLKGLISKQPYNDGDGASGRLWEAMTEDLITVKAVPEPDTDVKVSDRVRILEAPGAERFHGRVGTVLSVLGSHPTDLCTCSVTVEGCGTLIWATKVGPTTYTVDGTAYDLSAEYHDSIGDIWYFTGKRTEDGVPLMSCRFVTTFGDDSDNEYQDWSLTRVLALYPLTRV